MNQLGSKRYANPFIFPYTSLISNEKPCRAVPNGSQDFVLKSAWQSPKPNLTSMNGGSKAFQSLSSVGLYKIVVTYWTNVSRVVSENYCQDPFTLRMYLVVMLVASTSFLMLLVAR